MSAKETWEALRQCLIVIYLGLPVIITHDISTNFDFLKFYAETKMLGMTYHQISVEAY